MSTTYTTLVARLKATTEDDSTEFDAELPYIIDRAESKIVRALNTYGFVQNAYTSLTPSSPFLEKPSGTLVVKALNLYTDAGQLIQLKMRTNEFCQNYWPDRTSVGQPRYYANYGFDQLYLVPTPASALRTEMEYLARPATLSTSNQTNYITNFLDVALFYAAMNEACMFQKNYQAAAAWEQLFQNEIARLNNEGMRQTRDDQDHPNSPNTENV